MCILRRASFYTHLWICVRLPEATWDCKLIQLSGTSQGTYLSVTQDSGARKARRGTMLPCAKVKLNPQDPVVDTGGCYDFSWNPFWKSVCLNDWSLKGENHLELLTVCWFRSCVTGWTCLCEWEMTQKAGNDLFVALILKLSWCFCQAEIPSQNF